MSRGNRRLAIFKETSDYHEFLKCLAMTKETCAFTIHALCLMTNHFHMCIETEDVEIWKIMHRLLLTYAANYNIKYKLTGHLFENRYIGQLIEDDRYFLEVSRYIHLNPVKAGMVREPLSYEYSSYGLYVAGEGTLQAEKAGSMIADLVDTKRVPHVRGRKDLPRGTGDADHERHEGERVMAALVRSTGLALDGIIFISILQNALQNAV